MTGDDTLQQLRTTSGLTIRVRPMAPQDGPVLLDIFDHLGPVSRRRRFHNVVGRRDRAWLAQEANRAAEQTVLQGRGWLAMVDRPGQPGVPVAGARYIRVGPNEANFAISVRDDFQGQGIGSVLLKLLVEAAGADGVAFLSASILSDHAAAWRLLRGLALPVERRDNGGTAEVRLRLAARPAAP